MSLLKMCVYPAEVLKRKGDRVTDFGPETQGFINDLIEMMHIEDGVGLAATQVGVSKQIFVACPTLKKGEEIVVINPDIYDMKGEETDMEGCLSLPGIGCKVPRAKAVKARYLDREGKNHDVALRDFAARVFQHETDHLNGLLFIDRVDFDTRQELLVEYEQQTDIRKNMRQELLEEYERQKREQGRPM